MWLNRVRRGSAGCSVAQQGAAWLSRVRCGTLVSASAYCKAGPSSARHPMEVLLVQSEKAMRRLQEDRPRQMVKDE